MTNAEALEYAVPLIKSMKIKKVNGFNSKILIWNDKLACCDADNSVLYVTDIINTGTCLCGFLDDITNNPDYINHTVYQELITHLNYYTSINNWKLEMTELELDETFMSMVMSKASQGLQMYKLDYIALPIFYGIIPATKGDKISLQTIEYDKMVYAKYTLYKKKFKQNIDIYMKLLKLW